MKISNFHKVDLNALENVNLKSDMLLKNEKEIRNVNVNVLKPDEIKEIIKKEDEIYKNFEKALKYFEEVKYFEGNNAHSGGGRGVGR